MKTPRPSCDGCTECCYYLGVPSLEKPTCTQCRHVVEGGCGIYEARPDECRVFQCLWLDSQSRSQPWGKKLRPDKCGVMFVATTRPDTVAAHCRDERALSVPIVHGLVRRFLRAGIALVRLNGQKRTLIAIDNPKFTRAAFGPLTPSEGETDGAQS